MSNEENFNKKHVLLMIKLEIITEKSYQSNIDHVGGNGFNDVGEV